MSKCWEDEYEREEKKLKQLQTGGDVGSGTTHTETTKHIGTERVVDTPIVKEGDSPVACQRVLPKLRAFTLFSYVPLTIWDFLFCFLFWRGWLLFAVLQRWLLLWLWRYHRWWWSSNCLLRSVHVLLQLRCCVFIPRMWCDRGGQKVLNKVRVKLLSLIWICTYTWHCCELFSWLWFHHNSQTYSRVL